MKHNPVLLSKVQGLDQKVKTEIFDKILKIYLIIGILLGRKYFEEENKFPFKHKIAITRPKIKIMSSVFLQIY